MRYKRVCDRCEFMSLCFAWLGGEEWDEGEYKVYHSNYLHINQAMEDGRSCEDFLNMQSHQAISDNKIVNSAIPCCVLIFWHSSAHYLSVRLGWCQPAPRHHSGEGVLRRTPQHTPAGPGLPQSQALLKGQERVWGGTADFPEDRTKLGEKRGRNDDNGRGEN